MENLKGKKYVFIGKTLFFPRENILALGDLHLGYEEALRQRGLEVPLGQFEEIQNELGKVIEYIKVRYGKIGELRIVFLGDVKHYFEFVASEKEGMKNLISFLRKRGVGENHVVFIRGNHEKNDKSGKLCDFFIWKDIVFAHGHKGFPELYSKEINWVVMGHLHPTVTLSDEQDVKREKYKCFLVGRFKKKGSIVLPSFMPITEGISLNEFMDKKGYDYSIVPNKEIENFEVFVCVNVGEDAMSFGKLGDLKN